MPLTHVFEAITEVRIVDNEALYIHLEDGTLIGLPPAALGSAKVQVGDRTLLDLQDWNDGLGIGHLKVFRQHYTVLSCGIGRGCVVESPVLVN